MIEILCDNESCLHNKGGYCDKAGEVTINIHKNNCLDIETDFYTKMD